MNVTPSQNQPQYRQTHANPAFKANVIDLNRLTPELQQDVAKAIKAQIGDGDKLILQELRGTKAFVGINIKEGSVPDKIIIAVVDASKDLKNNLNEKLLQILKTLGIKEPEKKLAITNELDEIFKTNNITTVTTGHDDVYSWHYYEKQQKNGGFEHICTQDI